MTNVESEIIQIRSLMSKNGVELMKANIKLTNDIKAPYRTFSKFCDYFISNEEKLTPAEIDKYLESLRVMYSVYGSNFVGFKELVDKSNYNKFWEE